MPAKRGLRAWLDSPWAACSPACVQKAQKRQWWIVVSLTLAAGCFTGAFVGSFFVTGLGRPALVLRWTYLVALILLWPLALVHWSRYRYVGRRMPRADDLPHAL
jgi:hypothetical protein